MPGFNRGVWLYSTARSHIVDVTVITDIERWGRHCRILHRHRRSQEPPRSGWSSCDAEGRHGGRGNRRRGRTSGTRTPSLATRKRLSLRAPGRPAGWRRPDRPLRAAGGDPNRPGRRIPFPDQRRAVLFPWVRNARRPQRARDGDTTMHRPCTTSRSWDGSGQTRSGLPTTPTQRRCSTWPTRLGIVVIDETAAVGLNLGVGGGLFLGGPKTTFSEETIGSATQATHRRAIEELIARDKNHPCVVLWSLANEPESHTDEARVYFEPLFDLARRLRSHPAGRIRQHDVRPA